MACCSFTTISRIRTFRKVTGEPTEDGSFPLFAVMLHKPKQDGGKPQSVQYVLHDRGIMVRFPARQRKWTFFLLKLPHRFWAQTTSWRMCDWELSPRRSKGREVTSKAHFNTPPRIKKKSYYFDSPVGLNGVKSDNLTFERAWRNTEQNLSNNNNFEWKHHDVLST